jgi:hypothetical protein
MEVVKHVRARQVEVGGEAHSGWLPKRVAIPPPTPVRSVSLDLRILHEGAGGGYILEWCVAGGELMNDSWHASVAEAVAKAENQFGVAPKEWLDGDING